MGKRSTKRKMKSAKISVKSKFKKAMFKLRKMSKQHQRTLLSGTSNEFVKDLSTYLSRLRNEPNLVKSAKYRRMLKKHQGKLRRLINPNVWIEKKRHILMMQVGIIPFLIPIVCASIGAAGSVGAAATTAAISKA